MPEELTYIQAVNKALGWAMETYPECIVLGEDVALPGGPFGATKGLHARFGERIFDTPISESAMVGAALGAAMRGMRPVVEIMYGDFTLVAMDQIVNQVANTRYASNGSWTAPLTIRTQQGYSPGACAQHSQSLEALFAHTPGLRVGLPAFPADAYDMLRTAIASDDPTMVIEARMLYPVKGAVHDGPVPPMGGARVVRPGADVTVVTWSRMVHESLAAADAAAVDGIDVEVVDLRWLSPLDFDAVAASVGKTGHVVVAHEANLTGGFGGELAARVAHECFWDLEGPVVRVAAPDVPMPAAPSLQSVVVPQRADILDAVKQTLAGPVAAARTTA